MDPAEAGVGQGFANVPASEGQVPADAPVTTK